MIISVRARVVGIMLAMTAAAILAIAIPYLTTTTLLAELRTDASASVRGSVALTRLAHALAAQQESVRAFAATGDPSFLDRYLRAVEDEARQALSLSAVVDDEQAEVTLALLVAAAAAWRVDHAEPAIAAREAAEAAPAPDAGPEHADPGIARHLAALEARLGSPDLTVGSRIQAVTDIRTALFVGSAVVLLLVLAASARLIGRWVNRPLLRLVAAARAVEAGEEVSFPSLQRDEIGDLAAALERMRRRILAGQRDAQSAADQSIVINRFTELTAFGPTDEQLAAAILTALGELAEPVAGVVHLANRSRDRAAPLATVGGVEAGPVALGGLAACPGLRRGSMYVSPDVADPLAVRCPVFAPDAGTVACVPLSALGETVGAIHLHWPGADALASELRPVIARVAEHAALSIANRRLVSALRGMADTDARTGLANSRAFDEAVEHHLAGRPPERKDAVLMLDLDHFKAFNDRHGHPAGDEALRAFAGILRSCLREDDLAARYGGEEFAVFAPGVGVAGAREIAERIRTRVESTIVSLGPGATARISCSVGVAVAPADGIDRLTLLRAADAALYAAKQAGRNRTGTTADLAAAS